MSEADDLIRAAAEKHKADIYFYSGGIEDDGFGKLAEAVTENYNTDRDIAILILVTDGGSANAGYQIARLFSETIL